MEQVILVTPQDQVIGEAEKMQAHLQGYLHRAFSIFIFDSNNNLLLQQRSSDKYHCAGLWSNTCCGHPRPGEEIHAAAVRRLKEEMNINTALYLKQTLLYNLTLSNNLIEHEFNYTFIGRYEGKVTPNIAEVETHKWITIPHLKNELSHNDKKFTPWLPVILNKFSSLEKD